MSITEAPIWSPDAEFANASRLAAYLRWLRQNRGLQFEDYPSLWQWSVTDLEGFWKSIWDYYAIQGENADHAKVLDKAIMPGARWFQGVKLNYVDQVFRHASTERPAIIAVRALVGPPADEGLSRQTITEYSWQRLERETAAFAKTLRGLGVEPGDRVAAYLPNWPEAVIAFLACASIGAIWTICAPEMGETAVLDRWTQIEPKVLIHSNGYVHQGRWIDRREVVAAIRAKLASLRASVVVRGNQATDSDEDNATIGLALTAESWTNTPPTGEQSECRIDFDAACSIEAQLEPLAVDFDAPLWIVYSSGTTGLPKAIVHGHGGIIIEQVKLMGLHNNLGPDDRYLWFTSSGWIMWNAQVAGLLVGASIVTVDESPGWPNLERLWRLVDQLKISFFGAGAAFFAQCQKAGIEPRAFARLDRLRGLGSTGSPLSPEAYQWIYAKAKSDVWLTPMSGGTDFAGAFVGGNPMLPVFAGEMQCRLLGANVRAWSEVGEDLVDEVGELVCASPMPSMPLFLWNDRDGSKLSASYFDSFPGVWRHGDWIRITPRGGAIIYGRSDATINRHGVRIGTSELYRVIEEFPEVLESMVVDLEYLGREPWMSLFVVLKPGEMMSESLRETMFAAIRKAMSPRHVPNECVQAPDIPKTLSGKKMEVPIKKLMLGTALDQVTKPDAMANPECLPWYVAFAQNHALRQRQKP